jgi:CubicO group peptidase (beta-lactamase class C family)
LLVGIALAQGKIHSVDDRVLDFFPEYEPLKHLDERKTALTVRDLLTMRTGLDWSEDDYNISPLKELNECGCDWLRLVLNWRMREAPGSRFEYNSGGVILLGGIIRNVSGGPVDSFAEQYLFGPLGIKGARWFQGLPEGLPHMGGGLNLRATGYGEDWISPPAQRAMGRQADCFRRVASGIDAALGEESAHIWLASG